MFDEEEVKEIRKVEIQRPLSLDAPLQQQITHLEKTLIHHKHNPLVEYRIEPEVRIPKGLDDYVIPIGACGDLRYVMRRGEYILQGYTPRELITRANMNALAPLEVWKREFPNAKGGIDWDYAQDWLIQVTGVQNAGSFRIDRVRGRGAWFDNERSIVHLGDKLMVNGSFAEIGDIRSKNIYTRLPEIEFPIPVEEVVLPHRHELQYIRDAADSFDWKDPLDKVMFLGWIATAPICGGLAWRPHLWLTGSPGSGKSTAWKLIHSVLQAYSIGFQSSTTAASMRQLIGNDAIPVIFDEAEATNAGEVQAIQAKLELIRAASTETGAVIARGTASQKAITFNIRSMFFLSSVGDSLKYEQDKQRFVIIELNKPDNDDESIEKRHKRYSYLMEEMLPQITPELSAKFFIRQSGLIPTIRKNVSVFTRIMLPIFKNERAARQYGTLLAGEYSLYSEDVITIEEAIKRVNIFNWGRFTQETQTINALDQEMLNHLLGTVIDIYSNDRPTIKMTIEEAIYEIAKLLNSINKEEIVLALARKGLRYRNNSLFIANDNQYLAKIFSETPAAVNWNGKVFKKMKNAEAVVVRLLGKSHRGVAIPFMPAQNLID